MTNVLVCGGGSGGHVYPALALLKTFKRHPNVNRLGFMGTHRGVEARVMPKQSDIDFFPIQAGHLRGNAIHKLKTVVKLCIGMTETLAAFMKFRPGLIIGTGGYSSLPALVWGKALGIPTAILETNAKAGLANRLLGGHVNHVFCGQPATFDFTPKNICQSGIPVRSDLYQPQEKNELYKQWGLSPKKKTLLVLGGSLGAQTLNMLTLQLARRQPDVQIILSMGLCQQDRFVKLKAQTKNLKNLKLHTYIDRMDEAMALTDIAICRAGALTLAELSACGVPAIVVPWDGAADGHQVHNARVHEARGAGLMIREENLSLKNLAQTLGLMLQPQCHEAMHKASLNVGQTHRDACARIVKEVERYLDEPLPLRRDRRRWHERLGQNVLATPTSGPGFKH
jgi:UDP-N-acetylglucosamine--N-acetylmuramyl-(pentapeptide) pyrophosphoryl-undecaprenol N-acetylglucosamine transferase